jgi:hypothetical protein
MGQSPRLAWVKAHLAELTEVAPMEMADPDEHFPETRIESDTGNGYCELRETNAGTRHTKAYERRLPEWLVSSAASQVFRAVGPGGVDQGPVPVLDA